MRAMNADALLDALLDAGTYRSWDADPADVRPSPGYAAELGRARALTGAERGALIGFLGPRVYEALSGAPIRDGVQTAENLLAHGLVDAVVPADELAGYLAQVLSSLTPASAPSIVAGGPPPATPTLPA